MKLFSLPSKVSDLIKRSFRRPEDTLIFVFCHIPRTGGSSIWHQLARLSGNGLNTYDLFHETTLRYGGDLNFTRTVLNEDRNKLAVPMNYRLVVHHHIHIRIGDLFKVRRPVYITFIRDPLSRFVSDLRWNVRLFHDGEYFFDQDINRTKWAPFLSGEKPLIDLLQNNALIKPYLSFYQNWFWGLMHRDTNDIPWKAEFDQSEKIEMLDFVRCNFALIGFEHTSYDNEKVLASASPTSTDIQGISERARFHENLASLLGLQTNQVDSGLHYRGTVSREIDTIPDLNDPAFLDAVKKGMQDDYWFIEELRKMRLHGKSGSKFPVWLDNPVL